MSENYQTVDGKDVPTDVTDRFDAVDKWDANRVTDPENIPTLSAIFGKLYEGQVDGKIQFVSEWGNVFSREHFDFVETAESAGLPRDIEDRFTYDESIDVVHHDHYAEHVTTVVVVTENGRFAFGSRSGVVWGQWHKSDSDARIDTETKSIAMAVVDAENDIQLPDDINAVSTGWHSSMEKSEQSEIINALSKGDTPPEWDNSVYPYVVVFEDTRNVCSQPISIYGNNSFDEKVSDLLDNKRAVPAGSGL